MAKTMTEIQEAAQRYSAARQILVDTVLVLQREIDQVKAKYLKNLKVNVSTAKARHAELFEAVKASPELFVRPRTVVLHDVKVGFEKGKGKLVIAKGDEAKVVALIKKHFPEQADVLINCTEEPAKASLSKLPGSDLKKLGLEIQGTGDVVVLKDTGAEIEKLVAAFLKDETREAEGDEAREAIAA